MQDEIIRCENCRYFKVNLIEGTGAGSCSHVNALPFPSLRDFCSMAELKEGAQRGLTKEQQEEMFRRIHQERRGARR